jgi:hypothetical protein
MDLTQLLAKINADIRQKVLEDSINPDVISDVLDEIANFVNDNYILAQKEERFSTVEADGPDAIILVNEDDGIGGDGTESQFIRQGNKLFYLAAVEI